jgi:hypothetical protein
MFPLVNPDHQRVVDEFVIALESFLGVKKTEFSLNNLWKSSRPEGLEEDTINELLGTVSYHLKTCSNILTQDSGWI